MTTMRIDVTTPGATAPAASPNADLTLGSLFAHRYRIEQIVGRGGMGVVYRATDAQLDETVAIKTLPGDVMQRSPEDLEPSPRLRGEGGAQRRVRGATRQDALQDGAPHPPLRGTFSPRAGRRARRVAQLAQRLGLDLADALARDREVWPTSSSVCSLPSPTPKRILMTFSSRGVSVFSTLRSAP
jgi:serine/threonine protein kinase